MLPFPFPGKFFGELGLADVISPVSVADKAKSNDFDP